MIRLIVAIATSNGQDGVIGLKGSSKLLWKSSTDMTFFKKTTEGSVVVMGHNTYKSLDRPLPNRVNVVLSKSNEPGVRSNGVVYYNSISEIIKNYEDFYVIGGEEIYNLFLPIADEVFITSLSLDIITNGELSYFPLDKMEEDFYMTYESDLIEDIEELSKTDITLIFTKWERGIERYH